MAKVFRIKYDPINGFVTPDANIEECIKNYITTFEVSSEYTYTISVGSELLIDAFRVAIREDKVSHEVVEFEFEDQILKPDSNARLDHWPRGFGDIHSNFFRRLLTRKKS